jgi:hypothetical protein
MLTKKKLQEQDIFTIYTDGNYYDSNGEYVITFENGRAILNSHCEVNGIGEPIKQLMSLEDLFDTCELLGIY